MKNKKTWSELSPLQQKAIVAGAAVEAVVTTVAVIDLVRRPRDQVRGPKAAWLAALFVQPAGPIAYLAAGRRPQA